MDIVNALRNFGFSEYEAKVLITIANYGPLTAKEISEISGIPRTSVYDATQSLMAKGFVETFGKPRKFKCLAVDEIVNILGKRSSESLEIIKKDLSKKISEYDVVKIYRGDIVLDKIKELSKSSKEIIAVLSMVNEEIAENLLFCKKIVLVSSNAKDFEKDGWVCYEFKNKKDVLDWAKRYEICHGTILFDEKYTIIIYISKKNKIGIFSENRGILEFMKTLIEPLINFLK